MGSLGLNVNEELLLQSLFLHCPSLMMLVWRDESHLAISGESTRSHLDWQIYTDKQLQATIHR
jgi:hypothetical protein